MTSSFDIAILGAGPGGYVAAIRAAQLGMRVVVIDEREVPGGTCLNVGCIPSKALLHSSYKYWSANHHFEKIGILFDRLDVDLKRMQLHKDTVVNDLTNGIHFLFRKNKIEFVHGRASLYRREDAPQFNADAVAAHPIVVSVLQNDASVRTIDAKHIIIATGSVPIEIPSLPFNGTHILSSTDALALERIPHHLVVVGGGYIGLELGSVWRRLGSEVTVIEASEDIVMTMDHDIRDGLRKALQHQGISFQFDRRALGYRMKGAQIHLQLTAVKAQLDKEEMMSCDAVLVAVGRKPCTQGLRLEDVGVEINERGFVRVDGHYQTTHPQIYAIGDVVGGMMLAHKAEEEGVALVESLAGQAGHVNYHVIPAIVFTNPEVATVGITENEAKAKGMDITVGKFPLSGNSLSRATGETEGFVKIIADKITDRVLGVHILGGHAGAMIAEAAMAMEFHASSEDIARTCHAHPSYSEAMKEAAWATFSDALHK